jgi:hypothetical protein
MPTETADSDERRRELAALLARVIYRTLQPLPQSIQRPQKFPQSDADRLETVTQKSLCDTSVVNSVTRHGEIGEP